MQCQDDSIRLTGVNEVRASLTADIVGGERSLDSLVPPSAFLSQLITALITHIRSEQQINNEQAGLQSYLTGTFFS